MSNLTPLQIAQYAYQAGFRGLGLIRAVAVALAESGGNPASQCLNCTGVAEDSRGLWQINLNAHPGFTGDLYDPLYNAQAAFAVSNQGNDFSAWSTFTKGTYTSFIFAATTVAAEVEAFPNKILPSGNPTPPVAPTSPVTIGGITINPITIPPITVPGLTDLPGAIQGAGQSVVNAIQQALQPITSGIANFNQLLHFIDDPKAWTAVLMIGTGVIVTILGIVLFGLSLLPKSVQNGVTEVAGAAALA